jgi:hypothetical protein
MMQLDLIVLTKRKEMIRYCESFRYGGTMLSNIVANDLTHISVPALIDKSFPSYGHFTSSPSHGHFTSSPTHRHFTQCPIAKHKQPNNLINRMEAYASPNSSTKSHKQANNLINRKEAYASPNSYTKSHK